MPYSNYPQTQPPDTFIADSIYLGQIYYTNLPKHQNAIIVAKRPHGHLLSIAALPGEYKNRSLLKYSLIAGQKQWRYVFGNHATQRLMYGFFADHAKVHILAARGDPENDGMVSSLLKS
jgi:hypothetical protein